MKKFIFVFLLLASCHKHEHNVTPIDTPPPPPCQGQIVGRGFLFINGERVPGIFVDVDCNPDTRPVFFLKNGND